MIHKREGFFFFKKKKSVVQIYVYLDIYMVRTVSDWSKSTEFNNIFNTYFERFDAWQIMNVLNKILTNTGNVIQTAINELV